MKKRSLSIFLTVVSLLVFLPGSASAMRVFPTRQTVVVSVDQEQKFSFFVTNDTAEQKEFQGEIQAFSLDEVTGATQFYTENPELSYFRLPNNRISLPPGETGQFTAFFTAPTGMLPGSYYFVFFVTELGASGTEIGIGNRIGSLVFLHIAGEVQESLEILDFSSSQRIFVSTQPEIFFSIENTGNIHFIPKGDILINGQRQELNPAGDKVLSHGRWQKKWKPELTWRDVGKVSVRVVGTFGLENKTFVRDIFFWYLPWSVLITVGVGITVGGLTLIWRRKKTCGKK